MVPPQLARKMSVLSVDPPVPWAPGQISIAAGRAHRSPARFSPPRGRGGARGVESHRGQLAGPPEGVGVAGVGPGAAVGRYGGYGPRSGGPDFPAGVKFQLGRRLVPCYREVRRATTSACPPPPTMGYFFFSLNLE